MKNNFFLFIFLLITNIGLSQSDIEKYLFEMPDVIFEKIETPEGYQKAFKIMLKQPLDHGDHSKGFFYQKLYLSHKGFDRPTAIITNGYNKNSNSITEIAELINANQIQVEHRYFGESVPEDMDYQFLNFEEVTADLHRIRTLFGDIYTQDWLASGISKGGTTTIFYRYFYPDDVSVSVPYVAPINHDYEDPRIYTFLDKKGSDDCRNDLLSLQRSLLQDEDKAIEWMEWFTKGKGLTFEYLTLGEAYEYAVLELPFSFWQYGWDCQEIPQADKPLKDRVNYLLDVVGLDFYADASMKAFGSHYYQSATEMGYYGYETDDFQGLLNHLAYEPNPHAAFVPNKMKTTWDGSLTNKVAAWTTSKAERMIYINGALDTWSATAVPPVRGLDSRWYFMEGKHHASARIKNMTKEEKASLIQALNKWMKF